MLVRFNIIFSYEYFVITEVFSKDQDLDNAGERGARDLGVEEPGNRPGCHPCKVHRLIDVGHILSISYLNLNI